VTTTDRRTVTDNAVAATFVLGLEAVHGTLTIGDYQVAVQRLERAIRPWDSVVAIAPRTVGVLCSALTNVREVEAIAARLADVVRAPMAVGDEVRQVGVCVGSAIVTGGEAPKEAFTRAREAMQHMRQARSLLVAPEVPGQRADGHVVLPH
jgi:GGDEF domain-containing protein